MEEIFGPSRRYVVLWLRTYYHSLPAAVWDMNYKVATSFQYPLRPEFVESTWYLYRVSSRKCYVWTVPVSSRMLVAGDPRPILP